MMSLTSIFAIEIPVHDERVTDDADMLTTAEETELESQLQQLQDETGVELAILTIPTTDGQDIAQLGTEIAQSRGIGKSDIDNGILILIALNDRKWRINTGYGVE
ncbi:MAG: TPM domain-containing protein [Candidatus Peribacteria bacterium]|nr:MAG: TPM domain-containing protein [Candidatus Peribacteria bacterium]